MRPRSALGLAAAALLAGCGGATAPPPVLAVRVATPAQRSGAHATAFALGGARVLTVAHVLDGGRSVRAGGRRARVLRVDRRLDVAVLRAPGIRSAFPRLATARAGERVSVRVLRAGAARSLPASVRRTISARVGASMRPALELAAAVAPGDSGAPVLDGRGRVVGVLFAQAADRDGLAYALDARALAPLRAAR